MKPQRIMLWGWFGFENLGDDLLLKTMMSNLASDSRMLTIPMRTPYNIENQNIKQIGRSYKELFKGVLINDVLVIGPGGLFPFDNPKKVMTYLFITLLWKMLGRKVAFFGVGISERMNPLSSKLWKAIAQMSDLFITRSPGVIEKLNIRESDRIHTMADTVFASDLRFKTCQCENRVAIFIANLQQPGMEKEYQTVVKTWQDTVLALLNKGFFVDLIAFTKETDDRLASDIVEAFRKRGGVHIICYKDAIDAIEDLKRYKITISMRFHALVLSLLAEIPTVPIAYGHKTYSLAEKSGLSEYVMIWNSFQKEYYGYTQDMKADDLLQKVDLIISQYDEVKEKMKQHTENLKASAKDAMNQLLTIVDQ